MIVILGAIVGGALLLSQSSMGSELVQSVEDTVETYLPKWNKFDSLFQSAGLLYGVEWEWLKAFALNESSLGDAPSVKRGLENPNDVEGSKSSDGLSWGLMQVTLKTARTMDPSATSQKLNDPAYSVDLSARYIAQLMRMFSTLDDRYVEWVVKSYNQGPGNTKKEMVGTIEGYANEYWARWQRNLNRVEENS